MNQSPLALKIANQIIALINLGRLTAGDHLATDALARQFGVSRSPVRQAMEILSQKNLIIKKENRGFFVCDNGNLVVSALEAPSEPYYQFATDWLNDEIDSEVTEVLLRERYNVTKTQAQEMITRAAREGWAEPKHGYGWILRPVAKNHEAYAQIYRFRAVIEPAALLEVSFSYEKNIAEMLKDEQSALLNSNIEVLPQEYIVSAGVRFHEELIKMSGNPLYLQALERANQLRKLLEYRLIPNKARVVKQAQDHLALLALLQKGDNLEAAHFMRQHLTLALSGKIHLFS